jgi:hypothetical protein
MGSILRTASERHALRRQVRMPCQVVCEHDFTLLASECLDLSLDGMAVRARLPGLEGSPVIVSFRVPGSSLYIDASARIMRMNWGRRSEDRGAMLGLQFLSLNAIDRAILASRLRGLPPPVPARRVRVDYAASVRDIASEKLRVA